jgi:hypothetical protein
LTATDCSWYNTHGQFPWITRESWSVTSSWNIDKRCRLLLNSHEVSQHHGIQINGMQAFAEQLNRLQEWDCGSNQSINED